MQRHLQQDDLGDPCDFTSPLPTKSRILRQTCHHVGTGLLASTNPCPHPSSSTWAPAKGLSECSSWPPGSSMTSISVSQDISWEQLPERPLAWDSYEGVVLEAALEPAGEVKHCGLETQALTDVVPILASPLTGCAALLTLPTLWALASLSIKWVVWRTKSSCK